MHLKLPVTKENWLAIAYPGKIPEDAESVDSMPPEIRDLKPGEVLDPHRRSLVNEVLKKPLAPLAGPHGKPPPLRKPLEKLD